MRNVARGMFWAFLAMVCLLTWSARGQQNGGAGIQIDKSSIGGTVMNTSGNKPEADVWVIAETKSLQVPFRKIVVTDDQGRFLVPDLPAGAYELWVRGYGLKDSARFKASLGGTTKLTAESAANPQS